MPLYHEGTYTMRVSLDRSLDMGGYSLLSVLWSLGITAWRTTYYFEGIDERTASMYEDTARMIEKFETLGGGGLTLREFLQEMRSK